MNTEHIANGFSQNSDGIPFDDFDMLADMPRTAAAKAKNKGNRKPKPGRKPTTDFQKFLVALVRETGMSATEFQEFSDARGWRVPASTLTTTLFESTNPGIKTVEAIAITLGKDPLAVMAKALDTPPEDQMEGFGTSLLATAWNFYKALDEQGRQYFEHYVILPMIADMRKRLDQQG